MISEKAQKGTEFCVDLIIEDMERLHKENPDSTFNLDTDSWKDAKRYFASLGHVKAIRCGLYTDWDVVIEVAMNQTHALTEEIKYWEDDYDETWLIKQLQVIKQLKALLEESGWDSIFTNEVKQFLKEYKI